MYEANSYEIQGDHSSLWEWPNAGVKSQELPRSFREFPSLKTLKIMTTKLWAPHAWEMKGCCLSMALTWMFPRCPIQLKLFCSCMALNFWFVPFHSKCGDIQNFQLEWYLPPGQPFMLRISALHNNIPLLPFD